jgi:L-threonine kinase
VRLEHWSDLDVGKGMGSSTADIVAGARALATATGEVLSEQELATIATTIETSDGSMFDGMVAFQQKGEFVVRAYPWWPRFAIVMAIPPTTFRTESANFEGKLQYAFEYDQMMMELDAASEARRGEVFAAAATQSAKLNQFFVPNPWFRVLLDESERLGAHGVIVAHTGTVSGLLFLLTDGDLGIGLAGEVMGAAERAMVYLKNILPSSIRLELTVTSPKPILI